MTDLHDRLTALADDVPIGPTDQDLWARGRRLHRRRRVGSVAIVAVCALLLAVLGLFDWQQARTPLEPASSEPSLAIPDEFHEPSKWLPGTDGEPFDRLIAVLPTDRGHWFGSDRDWVGVSAETGEYRFLDLPDIAADEPTIALSPDGRHVAYWFSEAVPDAPAPAELGDPVVGYAVYDVPRGEMVVRETVESEEGLMPTGLAWADHDHVAAGYAHLNWHGDEIGHVGTGAELRMHDLATDRVTPWPGERVSAAGNGWTVAWGDPTQARTLEVPALVVRLQSSIGVPPEADPSGRRFAGMLATTTNGGEQLPHNRIAIATPAPGAQGRFEPVPSDTGYLSLIGWADDHTVLAVRAPIPADEAIDERNRVIAAVDVRTGEEERVTASPGLTDSRRGSSTSPRSSVPHRHDRGTHG